jgi:hypothetical protein
MLQKVCISFSYNKLFLLQVSNALILSRKSLVTLITNGYSLVVKYRGKQRRPLFCKLGFPYLISA